MFRVDQEQSTPRYRLGDRPVDCIGCLYCVALDGSLVSSWEYHEEHRSDPCHSLGAGDTASSYVPSAFGSGVSSQRGLQEEQTSCTVNVEILYQGCREWYWLPD
jgi:hypothetical protein